MTVTALCALLLPASAYALEGYDRDNGRAIEVLSLVGGDKLAPGSLLELALEDPEHPDAVRQVIIGEVLRMRQIGQEIELEILDRDANDHFFFEIPADGISEIIH